VVAQFATHNQNIALFAMAVTMAESSENFAHQMAQVGLNHRIHEISKTSHKLLGSPQKFGGNTLAQTKVYIMILQPRRKDTTMEHIWKLDWKNEAPFEDVEVIQIAQGKMFCSLEVQEHHNGEVIGTAWVTIAPTYWDTGDVDCVFERSFESVGAAKAFLEQYDADALAEEQRLDALMVCE
jgi:hypothetical protein